ncbi:MAG: acetate--CoA ligase family protein [Anaerolineales bacterium]|nr:acetate--CoA ligase family protein [Anaerolineales bacterium]
MREFFYPSSVAVIGVSAKPTNLGRNIVANLVEYDFNGIVYAVGPSGGAIETRRIYHSVLDIPDHVDLAVVFTPAHTVPAILEQCGQKGIPRAIIETAGFREYTEEGRQLEDQICEISRRYGIHFIGPNCIGAINMENGFCVPFPRLSRFVKRGEVSIITQSGGVGMSVLNLLANEGLGLNKFVSVGNMLDKTAEDLLEYLIEDDQTGLIFLYLESIGDGRRLMEIARRSEKPILAFKSNIGRLGQKIALSHTASLTSDDRVVDAAFHQAGVARVRDATTLGNNLKIMRLPAMKGRNLGVISRSGGHAVIAADACELSGFELAEFPDEFLREIEKHFRASVIRLTNPLDLGDLFDLDVYADIIERTLQLEGVDGIVFLHTSLSEEENLTSRLLLDRIMELAAKYNKPVAYFISAASQEVAYLKQNYSYPIFTQVVETVRALEISHYRYQQYQRVHTTEPLPKFVVDREPTRRRLEQAQAERRDLLLSEALLTLEDYGIRAAPSRAARTRADAERAAAELGYPVAIKIISAQISHKTDVGGVQLNLRSAEELGAAYDDMLARLRQADPTAQLESVLVQPMVSRGRELILGGRQDPQFGPVVLVGLGGIFVELFNDISVRVAPITHSAAVEMLENLHSFRMLKGARGQPPPTSRRWWTRSCAWRNFCATSPKSKRSTSTRCACSTKAKAYKRSTPA